MESHEVLRDAIHASGVKAVAADMNVSSSLVYKWCQPHYSGGADNPLDRLNSLCDITSSDKPLEWICEKRNGYFVKNETISPSDATETTMLEATQNILKEFSDLLEAISRSTADGKITEAEARTIRREWEDLKRLAEGFTSSCEKGDYDA